MSAFYTETAEGVVVSVRAQPRSSRSGIEGLLGDALKVRIRCAPVDGKANRELVETLADAFDLPKSSVVFKGGETSKQKRLLLRGLSAMRFKEILTVKNGLTPLDGREKSRNHSLTNDAPCLFGI